MIAIDTNIVVRMIMSDDKSQLAKIEERLPEGFFVSHGVLMETEWVLRSAYGLKRGEIHRALLDVMLLNEMRVLSPSFVQWALDQYGEGADFADMLHVVAARGASEFLTFDKDLAKAILSDAPVRIELLA